ncbi:hypothetical protein [Clavibacter zhangzhiyongii]|uniref:hypothetical protein n=1 Tax=Clavibacter zhangzhiyongii TaxID=2768071 RepID=UPI0039DFB86C
MRPPGEAGTGSVLVVAEALVALGETGVVVTVVSGVEPVSPGTRFVYVSWSPFSTGTSISTPSASPYWM